MGHLRVPPGWQAAGVVWGAAGLARPLVDMVWVVHRLALAHPPSPRPCRPRPSYGSGGLLGWEAAGLGWGFGRLLVWAGRQVGCWVVGVLVCCWWLVGCGAGRLGGIFGSRSVAATRFGGGLTGGLVVGLLGCSVALRGRWVGLWSARRAMVGMWVRWLGVGRGCVCGRWVGSAVRSAYRSAGRLAVRRRSAADKPTRGLVGV